jgi:uncharacterized protein (TIGR01777 family)
MNIFMTGGTGFVGTTLTRSLIVKGHKVTLLTRNLRRDPSVPTGVTFLEGNPTEQGRWQEKVAEHDVIINLAGASIFRRWTKSAKSEIWKSRISTTRNIVDAMKGREGKETHFLSTSAVGYYGFHGEEELDEESPQGEDFLASLSGEWESSALKARGFGARVVLLRYGIVLGADGGALKQMVPLYKGWLGAPLGNGKQWFPWIHEQDLSEIHRYLLERKDIAGPINCTSPYPVRNRELTEILGSVLGRPTFMPAVPSFVMKIVLGEFGSVLVKGQKVLPKKLMNRGFSFKFPHIKDALRDLLSSGK